MITKACKTLLACLTVCLTFAAASTHAGLIGKTLSGAYYYPDQATVYPFATTLPGFVVGPGSEGFIDVESVTDIVFDFDDLSLATVFSTILTSPTWNAVAFNGVIFSSATPLGISNPHVTTTTMPGFDDSRVTVTATEIKLNFQGLSYADGANIAITFEEGPPVGVPEPATWTMMLLGFLAIFLRYRQGLQCCDLLIVSKI